MTAGKVLCRPGEHLPRLGEIRREVPLDNIRALILYRALAGREVARHPRLYAFAQHRGFRIRAWALCRARTESQDERGVGYVKNAVAERRIANFAALEARLAAWTRVSAICVYTGPWARRDGIGSRAKWTGRSRRLPASRPC